MILVWKPQLRSTILDLTSTFVIKYWVYHEEIENPLWTNTIMFLGDQSLNSHSLQETVCMVYCTLVMVARKTRRAQQNLHTTCLISYDILKHKVCWLVWFKYNLPEIPCTTKCNPTGVWTHDLNIIGSTFHVPEMIVWTTEPSGTSWLGMAVCPIPSDLQIEPIHPLAHPTKLHTEPFITFPGVLLTH